MAKSDKERKAEQRKRAKDKNMERLDLTVHKSWAQDLKDHAANMQEQKIIKE